MSSRLFCPFDGKAARLVRSLALLLVLAWGSAAARADIQTVRPRNQPKDVGFGGSPPNAVPQSVQVKAGGQVEIILQAHGQDDRILNFMPRTQPAHGKLAGLHSLGRNSAAVTYLQDSGDDSAKDSFTFAVQARGSLVSAPVAVDIEIVPPAPRLAASPGDLDFGAVNVGEISRARITLENQGGGTAIGQLQPPPPWEVEGAAEYRLAKNQRQSFQLIFRPAGDQVYEDDIRVGRDPDQRARLIGTGVKVAGQDDAVQTASKTGASAAPPLIVGEPPPGNDRVRNVSAASARAIPFAVASAPAASGQDASSGVANSIPLGDGAFPPLAAVNDAAVGVVRLRGKDTHSIRISWSTPTPPPKSYRIELRYLYLGPDQELRIDWRPYAKVDVRVGKGETEATLRGLPSGTRHTLRVVAVDHRGQLAAPSGILQADLPPGFSWGITPFRVVLLALLVCAGLVWRRRRQEQAFIEEIEALPIPSMREW